MRDDICTIPVSEVFEVNDGCPICRMKKTVETHIIDYIMGAAMMEPDVRIETNKKGFCREHFRDMLSHRGRLALALMIETHLDEQKKAIFDGKLFNSAVSKAKKVSRLNESCFICDKIEWGMSRMVETLYRCYETEMDFRELFNNQKCFCLPHYEMLVNNLDKKKMRNYGDAFLKNISRITEENIERLSADIKNYCKVYNYQGNKENCDWENAKDSVERSINFLTAQNVE
ncbi:MAG: hypothetical protein E7531_02240 [Ruminococcaceae bacterium]|nr:hypothetical protein [Oscillospiraceae bacterium]